MKKIILSSCLALFVLLSGTTQAENFKVTMGTEGAYPPFNLIDKNGNPAGFDVEIGEALCNAMQAECTWVTSDWDGIIPGLLAKKFDTIVASMSITDERKKKIGFTDKYYSSPVKFARLKGSTHDVTPEAIKGKIIGVQGGVVAEDFAKGTFGDTVTVKAYKTQDEANLDLLSGRVDLIVADSTILDEFLKSDKGATVEFIGPDFNDETYLGDGIGIGVRQEDTELRDKLNAAIKQIRTDGTYQKINAKYFDFDLYGG